MMASLNLFHFRLQMPSISNLTYRVRIEKNYLFQNKFHFFISFLAPFHILKLFMVFFCTALSYWDNPIRVAFRIEECQNTFAIYNLEFAILFFLIKKRESGNVPLAKAFKNFLFWIHCTIQLSIEIGEVQNFEK